MPSKLFLHGDDEPFYLVDAADEVVDRLERSEGWVRLDMLPHAENEPSLPCYIHAFAVSAVGPLDAREIAYAYEHPPEWLDD